MHFVNSYTSTLPHAYIVASDIESFRGMLFALCQKDFQFITVKMDKDLQLSQWKNDYSESY